jgi:deazaflavin-dependent oxidoreductase (nitroreductase family)
MKINPLTRRLANWISWAHIGFYRASGGASSLNQNTLILTTRGRKSGREISKPLLYYQQDSRIYIVASYGGNDNPPAWYLNLSANPEVKIQIGSSTAPYRARMLAPDEKREIWPKVVGIHAGYEGYQRSTTRDIPIVELVPAA